jgi:hypothetical protein
MGMPTVTCCCKLPDLKRKTVFCVVAGGVKGYRENYGDAGFLWKMPVNTGGCVFIVFWKTISYSMVVVLAGWATKKAPTLSVGAGEYFGGKGAFSYLFLLFYS